MSRLARLDFILTSVSPTSKRYGPITWDGPSSRWGVVWLYWRGFQGAIQVRRAREVARGACLQQARGPVARRFEILN